MFVSVLIFLFLIENGQMENISDRIIALKRKTSHVLTLQGVQFDGEITQIQFDGISWGNIELDDRLIQIMNEILNDEIYRIKRKNMQKCVKLYSELLIPVSKFYVSKNSTIIYYSLQEIRGTQLKNVIRSLSKNLIICEYGHKRYLTEVNETAVNREIPIILFTESNGYNYAQLGMQPDNSSTIHVTPNADNKTINMLLMTALGFRTPLWRKDRDKYVTINWTNIDDKYKYLFHKWNIDFLKHLSHSNNEKYLDIKSIDILALKANKTDFEARKLYYNFNSSLHCSPTQYAKDNNFVTWTPKVMQQIDKNTIFDTDSFLASYEYCAKIGEVLGWQCLDLNVKCLSWKEQNVCSKNEVKEICKLACGECAMITPTKCDDRNQFCPDWATAYCDKTSPVYEGYMRKVCQKSCGCPDFNKTAPIIEEKFDSSWKSLGETNDICDNPQQQTFMSSEKNCLDWCSSKNQKYCFWDVTEKDGFCFATRDCNLKLGASRYHRFILIKEGHK